ncbi:phytase [uncultured Chitinophaga sp.]|uniref:phytase n=1 Tax=uncultured Chitinophaga sp. TaxID=339340 RepID=UPI00260061AD|nr:phytase [uncultured Chitinophaga sp.]
MFRAKLKYAAYLAFMALAACGEKKLPVHADAVKPVLVTEQTGFDTDDPAIWINAADTAHSLIVGTDKDTDGGLYTFDLAGKVQKKVALKRPNNVDITYGFMFNGKPVDIAVVTERETNTIRIFSLPGLEPLDNGGISVFDGETERGPMGIALYKRPSDSAVFAIVGRKSGPAQGYLWQYRLEDGNNGSIKATVVRKFGAYSGKKEIEAIAVDQQLGYVYYSDETVGIRKYNANPGNDQELNFFGKTGFASDHEGISIYPLSDTTGYILVSNQQNNTFVVFKREGDNAQVAEVPVSTDESDGSEVTAVPLSPKFPNGLFVAMSNGKVFHYYDWRDIQQRITAQQK